MKKLLLLLSMMLACTHAMACSCIFHEGPIEAAVADAYSSASAVVLATAEHVEYLEPFVSNVWSAEQGHHQVTSHNLQRTQFSPLKIWKGELEGLFYTEIGIACCVCGYHFEQGETYLLYLYGPDEHGNYTTSSCSRTKSAFGDIKQELAILDSLARPHGDD